MAAFITDVSSLVTASFGWLETGLSTVISSPLLIFSMGFFVLGAVAKLIGRFLSK